jgi:EAL domain-containing protein (putative c-di-GMP-specific phosphodiesterase class I)
MRGDFGSDAATEPIPPGSFLPVAEEFGLVTEIDRWAIDRSTETLVLLRDLGVDYGQGFYIGRPAELEIAGGVPTTEGDQS